MAEIAETYRVPAVVINGKEYPSFVVCPGAPIEYFSRALTDWICDRWREVDDPLFSPGIAAWLMGVRSTVLALNCEGGLDYQPSCWTSPAIDDLDTLILLAYARRWAKPL